MAESFETLKARAEKIISLSENGQWEECVRTSTEFLNMEQQNVSIPAKLKVAVLLNRAAAYRETRLFDPALDDLSTALKVATNNHASIYCERGIVFLGKGEIDRAIADFNAALELDPKHAIAYNNRGAAYAEKGEYDRAISDYNKAIEIDRNNTSAFHNRARAASLAQARKEREELRKQHEEQLKKLREEYKGFLKVEEYKDRQGKYQGKSDEIEKDIEEKIGFLKNYSFGVLSLVAVLVIAHIILGVCCSDLQFNILIILPLITVAAGLCSVPLFWDINTLKKEKVRLMALSQDAYTKGEMVTVISADIVPEAKKDLLLKFFDHHAQHGSAQLIIDLENNAKSDSNPVNILTQQLKDNPPDKD